MSLKVLFFTKGAFYIRSEQKDSRFPRRFIELKRTNLRTQLENKINYLEKSKINVNSLKKFLNNS